ncbi:MAG: helix-turn-helix transcriptional regulator [Anaerolineae bacterium]|nr:helix-turn-helix transcriptional regulator [Anaerolineae bacterium]
MAPKPIPKQLGDKLRTIREREGWTLDQMAEAVGRTGPSRRTRVYEWETGARQPDLPALLAYARLAGVSTDILIDDELELDLGKLGSTKEDDDA